jgi:hypothetical protein
MWPELALVLVPPVVRAHILHRRLQAEVTSTDTTSGKALWENPFVRVLFDGK